MRAIKESPTLGHGIHSIPESLSGLVKCPHEPLDGIHVLAIANLRKCLNSSLCLKQQVQCQVYGSCAATVPDYKVYISMI